ncbi:MAG: transglycosylase domain-containing protein [Clostridia bacterium]
MRNKKKIGKLLINSVIIVIVIIFSISIIGLISFYNITKDSFLSENLLIDKTNGPIVLSADNSKITESTYVKKVNLIELPKNTINAFLSSEDKKFYSHHGIDVKRIIGATITNIGKGKFAEGGSTISQQLIKNTHLGSEKTINRKIKEIKLTMELEKKYSKNKILEMYLNKIYFGNSVYGIESASKFYFNKKATNLTLSESAMLAGIISSPSNFNPKANLTSAIKKRNIVLKTMKNDGKINENEYLSAINQKIKVPSSTLNYESEYYKETILEATKLLKLSEDDLKSRPYIIKTYNDNELQLTMQNNLNEFFKTNELDNSCLQSLVIDSKTGKVIAHVNNSNISSSSLKRQVASTIKPVLVYAPAFEYNGLSPENYIEDNEFSINGYNPQNANKQYHGNIKIKDAIALSLNVPAVKILNETGIEESKTYAKKLGITFDNNDNNLSLALGGFTTGITMKQITNSYLPFSNFGKMITSTYIKEIISPNGKIVYQDKTTPKETISPATSYLINTCLRETVQKGTASKLKSLPFYVCSKTGTTGKDLTKKNTDALNISFTSEHIIGTMIFDPTNNGFSPLINGGTYPTFYTEDVLKTLYSKHIPKNPVIPKEISMIKLSENALTSDNKLKLAPETAKERYICLTPFDNSILPKTTDNNIDNKTNLLKVEKYLDKNIISFITEKDFNYILEKQNKSKTEILLKIKGDGNDVIIKDTYNKNTKYNLIQTKEAS